MVSELTWAKAHTNIALVKYWGKRDKYLYLPNNSSISISLDGFYTQTGVGLDTSLTKDYFVLDGHEVKGKSYERVVGFMNRIRQLSGRSEAAYIESMNYVPINSGFASSASGFSALAASAAKAYGLPLDYKSLSVLARQGSGSASRSILGGYVIWHKGVLVDGSDSFSEQLLQADEWKLSILSVTVQQGEKSISSTEGMDLTTLTSPFYRSWLDSVDDDLKQMRLAIRVRDFELLGRTMEHNALKMHGMIMASRPGIIYWNSGTLEVISCVTKMRQAGVNVYFTIDAGANVKVLCQPSDEIKLLNELEKLDLVQKVTLSHPGQGVTYIEDPMK